MARTPSKIMSVAEKKAAQSNLKQAIKVVDTGVKESEALVAVANKGLAEAKKKADALAAAASKQHDLALKEGGKLIAAAQKLVDAATKKHTKVFDAAAKGREKLNGQLATLEATPAEPGKRGPKAKTETAAA